MQIKEMFEKDIERNIKGVIKVGQQDEETIYQELDEYIVTNELFKHFSEFFSNYSKGIMNPTDDIGVWISGFFGSGKSHFLKILSYILDSNLLVKGKKPMDFFEGDKKIKDPMVIADMNNATNVSTDVILFNIDSKASHSVSNRDDILSVFIKVFNEMRGYCGSMPFLANFEKKLDEHSRFDEFKQAFKEINGDTWENTRDDYYFIQSEIIQAIVKIGFMSEEEANRWADKAEDNINLSIENFANEINQYCESKGNNHHVAFLVDEVGQYIAEDTTLMLNLQTIVEELGIKCHGKAWVIVTSQQNIDDITKGMQGMDFSKIQGRFKTRLSLSSSNVDEVIRRRILLKNDVAKQRLEAQYSEIEATLKNILTFDGEVEMKTYENAEDFQNIYPFVPYQFARVQDVLTSIREHSASGRHMADGERSMLALFQESAIFVKDKTDGALVSFNIFYNAVEKFIDHSHRIVITRAENNNLLYPLDVEVLKVLFLIKYVKEIKATSKNLTTLMISNVHEDRLSLNNKIDKSLKRLLGQTLIQKNGDEYSFLTDEEQDVNREIKNELVDPGEILDAASNRIFEEIYPKSKYRVNNRYNFPFNQAIDNREKSKRYDIGMRIVTPYYEFKLDMPSGQTKLDDADNNAHNVLKGLSEQNNESIIHLRNDLTVFEEIKEILQIYRYLQKHSDLKAGLKSRKQEEYNNKNERVKVFLEEAIKDATIYVKGDKINIAEKNVESRLDEAMGKLVDKVYNKLNYMDFAPDKSDILTTLKSSTQETFGYGSSCLNALNDVDDYVNNQFKIHNNPKLSEILERFSKKPYGFQLLDIQWLVATLFSQKRISLTLNSKELSIKSDGAEKILNYLTRREFAEKLLLSPRGNIGNAQIKSVKNLLKEVYNQNVTTTDEEQLMDLFIKYNDEKLKKISNCLLEFKSFSKYPGKHILEEAKELFNEVNTKNTVSQFYKFVHEKEDDFLDINDDLSPLFLFFEGAQKTIFEKSCQVYDVYDANKNLIEDSELEEIANSIKKILDMPNPYSKIKDLPELNNNFENKLNEILEEDKKRIKIYIDDAYDEVMQNLDTEELKNKFEAQFRNEFDKLSYKLDTEENISIIKGMANESEILRNKCYNKINNFVNTTTTKPDLGPVTLKKESNLNITNIIQSSRVKIETEEDINNFLEKIKEKVKKELESNDIIYLKL